MSKHRDALAARAVGDQGQDFVRRMQEMQMIPLVVLGFRVEDRGGGNSEIQIGSLWGNRLEESASDQERQQLESLLGELSGLLGKWMAHDRERLD